MTSLLYKKISLSDGSNDEALGSDPQLSALFAPLHKSLCENLKALTGQDCEEANLNISSLTAQAQQAMIEATSIKVLFSDQDTNVIAIGTLSPALADYVAQASLQIANNNEAPSEDYKPSKLDALLLRPLPQEVSEALRLVFNISSSILPQVGLSFESLKFGKSEMKDLGELAQINFPFSIQIPEKTKPSAKPKTKAKAKAKNKAKPQTEDKDLTSPLWLKVFLPLARLQSLANLEASQEGGDAVIIDTAHPWALHMRDAVKKADMPIRAVVESCHMTIAECTRLEIGQVIALPGVSLNAIGIFIDTDTGDDKQTEADTIELAQGSLGVFKKNRALKLIENIDPSFTHDCDWLTI